MSIDSEHDEFAHRIRGTIQDVVSRSIGCSRCARGMCKGIIVLAQCRACAKAGLDFEPQFVAVGWIALGDHLETYVLNAKLPTIRAVFKSTPRQAEATGHYFVPMWLDALLAHGTVQRKGYGHGRGLDWVRVLQRCTHDTDFREALTAAITICPEPKVIYDFVASVHIDLTKEFHARTVRPAING